MGEILISKSASTEWQAHSEERVLNGANPNLRWRFLFDASKHQNEDLSMGCLRVPVGESLPLHYHEEQEIYYILQGKGEVLMSATDAKSVRQGDSVYIPKSTPHGMKNIGETDFMFLWIFPTDSWHDVEYNYITRAPEDFSK